MSDNVVAEAVASQILPTLGTERTFSSGSTGYHTTGKIVGPGGARYQVTLLVVKIGSKPASKVPAKK